MMPRVVVVVAAVPGENCLCQWAEQRSLQEEVAVLRRRPSEALSCRGKEQAQAGALHRLPQRLLLYPMKAA